MRKDLLVLWSKVTYRTPTSGRSTDQSFTVLTLKTSQGSVGHRNEECVVWLWSWVILLYDFCVISYYLIDYSSSWRYASCWLSSQPLCWPSRHPSTTTPTILPSTRPSLSTRQFTESMAKLSMTPKTTEKEWIESMVAMISSAVLFFPTLQLLASSTLSIINVGWSSLNVLNAVSAAIQLMDAVFWNQIGWLMLNIRVKKRSWILFMISGLRMVRMLIFRKFWV